jgi:hypothetical protein
MPHFLSGISLRRGRRRALLGAGPASLRSLIAAENTPQDDFDMDSPTRRLRQRRAALTAAQGDPELPIGGTFYARLIRLRAELRLALMPDDRGDSAGGVRPQFSPARQGHLNQNVRSVAVIHADLRAVLAEILRIQNDIDRIDALIAIEEAKPPR